MNPDVLIIGGGINGIGIARELAFRGVSVLLVEKNDLCSGTSSESSKLVHGGIRYLEHGEFSLVADACRERFFLIQNAPHLVEKQPFIIPIYKEDRRPPWMIRIGLWLYELMALHRGIGHNRMIRIQDALSTEPLLRSENLVGAAEYFDGKMDDARLGIELAMQARDMGAQIWTDSPVVACQLSPHPTATVCHNGELITIHPKVIMNATGPWTDQTVALTGPHDHSVLKPTQGIHLITRPLVSTHALLISAASDNRVLFVIPHGDYSIVGTTDTPYSGSPDSVTATAPDIQYLMNEVERVFDLKLTRSDIYATFAGLRPLANSVQDTPAAISRDHELIRHSESFFSIIGGKYTTFRSMSEDAAKAIMKRLSLPFLNSTRTLPLGPGPFLNHEDRLTRLSESVRHSIANEFACHISDYLRRRTDAFFRKGNGLEIVDEVAAIFAEVLQWTPEQTAAETEAYRNQVATMHAEINLVLP